MATTAVQPASNAAEPDDARKIDVLKNAVVKLARQKAEADERANRAEDEAARLRTLAESLQQQQATTTTTPTPGGGAPSSSSSSPLPTTLVHADPAAAASPGGGKGGLAALFPSFRRGAKRVAAQSAADAAVTAPTSAVLDPTAIGDLLRQNEELHVELFEKGRAFAAERTQLRDRCTAAETRCEKLEGQLDDVRNELSTALARQATGTERQGEQLAALQQRLRQLEVRLRFQPPIVAFDAVGALASVASAAIPVAAQEPLLNTTPMPPRSHNLRDVGSRGWRALDALVGLLGKPPASTPSTQPTLAAAHAALRACANRCELLTPLAEGETHDQPTTTSTPQGVGMLGRLACVLHDHAPLLWQSALRVPTQSSSVSTKAAWVAPALATRRVCAALAQQVASTNHCIDLASNGMSADRILVADLVALRQALLGLLHPAGLEDQIPASDEVPPAFAIAIRELAAALHALIPSGGHLPPSSSASTSDALNTRAPDRRPAAVHSALELAAALSAATPCVVGGSQGTEAPSSSTVPAEFSTGIQTAPASASFSPLITLPHAAHEDEFRELRRLLRIADDQAALWRRQLELALVELDDRSAVSEARAEEIVVLRSAVAKEQRNRQFTHDALQRQIEVLSEQLTKEQQDSA